MDGRTAGWMDELTDESVYRWIYRSGGKMGEWMDLLIVVFT